MILIMLFSILFHEYDSRNIYTAEKISVFEKCYLVSLI